MPVDDTKSYSISVIGGSALIRVSSTTNEDGSESETWIGINSAKAGTTISLSADEETKHNVFVKWKVVSGGVTLSDETDPDATFVMPGNNVKIKAVYKAAADTEDSNEDNTNVQDGNEVNISGGYVTTDKDDFSTYLNECGPMKDYSYYAWEKRSSKMVSSGEKVYIQINKERAGTKKTVFSKWEVVSGNVTIEDPSNPSTSFVMGAEDVKIKAVYKKRKSPLLEEGKQFKYKGNTYEVISEIDEAIGMNGGRVELHYLKDGVKKLVIPQEVKYKGNTYWVTGVGLGIKDPHWPLEEIVYPKYFFYYEDFNGFKNIKKVTFKSPDLKARDFDLMNQGGGYYTNINKKAVIYVPKANLKEYEKYLRKYKVIDKTTKVKGF